MENKLLADRFTSERWALAQAMTMANGTQGTFTIEFLRERTLKSMLEVFREVRAREVGPSTYDVEYRTIKGEDNVVRATIKLVLLDPLEASLRINGPRRDGSRPSDGPSKVE